MKLLITTQVVDKNHPVLGFFCGWIEEFSTQCKHVTVIGQQCGEYAFASNVTVLSLGKEHGRSKLSQVTTFYKLIWQHRREYDSVFVHMIPLWIVLGSPLWKLLKKPIYLWYEARSKTLALRLSLLSVHKHFSASQSGMLLRSAKHVVVGHGINTNLFTYDTSEKREPMLLSVGRITAAKKPLEILEWFASVRSNHALRFAGITVGATDEALLHTLTQKINELDLANRVTVAPCNYEEIVHLYQRADILLHMSTTPLDKALLEAMACGCIVVGTSVGVQTVAEDQYCKTAEECTAKLQELIDMPEEQKAVLRAKMRTIVMTNHTLHTCIQKLLTYMERS